MSQIIKINALCPDPALIDVAVSILKQGGVIAYPTETFYALGADGFNTAAIDKIYGVKGRTANNPIALIGGNLQDVEMITDDIPEAAGRLIKIFWPGPLTLVFKASPRIEPRLTAKTGKIGIRISRHPIAQALTLALAKPITATSANISGAGECVSAVEVLAQVGRHIDLLIDGGETPGGKGSTVVDMTLSPPLVLRKGAIADAQIMQAWAEERR